MKAEQVVGHTIRKLRQEMGWYAAELAYRIPINRSYLSEIEHSKKAPSIGMMNDIALALKMTPSEFWHAVADEMEVNAR